MKKIIIALMSAVSIAETALILRDRGLGKEDDKSMLSEAVNALSGSLVFGETVTMEYKGQTYAMVKKYNPYLLSFLGCTGGIACTSGTLIVTSNIFRRMPKNIQKGTIAHEFGHMINGHAPSKKLQFSRIIGGSDSLKYELEADRTATAMVGTDTMISTLEYLLTIPFINKRELGKRLAALREV